MKVLAIRLARFGDTVLLLPALNRLKERLPGCHLTLLTDSRLESLARLSPAVDDVIAVDRVSMRDGGRLAALRGMFRLVGDIRRRRFDLVIDFHGFRETNLIALVSGARRRLGLRRFDQPFWKFCFNLPPVLEQKSLHAGAMFLKVVEALGSGESGALGPGLEVPEAGRRWSRERLGAEPYAVLYVDAPVPQRRWPTGGFAEVGDYLAEHSGLRTVIVSGQNPDLAAAVVDSMKHREAAVVLSGLSVPQLAAVIQSADLLVANDTGPMHLGPAFGVPTVALFSVGLPEHFRPTGIRDEVVKENPIERILASDVVAAVDRIRTAPIR